MVKRLNELNDEEMETHLNIVKYGDFVLTDAVRPSLEVVPQQGYKKAVYVEPGLEVPVLLISASKEILFELFMETIDLLGNKSLGVVLETSHSSEDGSHSHLINESVDAIALKSNLYDFEELLIEDGCAGIVVINFRRKIEVQFDEHKIISFYNWTQVAEETTNLMKEYNIPFLPEMKMITDAEHVHSSSEELLEQFEKLKDILGVSEEY